MSTTITGIVTNGVVVPSARLPEGAHVEIRLQSAPPNGEPVVAPRCTPQELRRMPRAQRQEALATAAALAEQDYRFDKELTGFEAFAEEEIHDGESDAR